MCVGGLEWNLVHTTSSYIVKNVSSHGRENNRATTTDKNKHGMSEEADVQYM